MRRLLVTGAAGFIGANFVHYWVARHPEDLIIALDALTYAGNRESLAPILEHPQFRFVHGDIRNRTLVASLLKEAQIDTIVHFAAESHVDRSISGPGAFIETNVVGTYELLEAARATWLGSGTGTHYRFHHVSTDEVYGSLEANAPPFTEETRYDPQSPYAASKAASDHLVRAYGNTYGLCYTISNCSNNYGPYQFPEKLIPLCITNLLDGIQLPVYGDGQNVRDWLHVEDHCRGIELILDRGHEGQTYNIGGDCQQTNLSLVRRLCAIMDTVRPNSIHYPHDGLIRFVADRPGHDRRYAIDACKIGRELGYITSHSVESGLATVVRWYIEHEAWWRPLLPRSGLPSAIAE